jgi:ABC-type nitrate/sulfonate/bicarbonate transport system ATPase subunit/ABC-type nitrate/sulfonate/bicarbonate transport system permease component
MPLQKKHIPGIAGVASMLIIWQIAATAYSNPAMFPGVTDLFSELWKMIINGNFYVALLFTIIRGLVGFLIAASLAGILASIALHHQAWKLFIHPWVVTIRSVPVISLVLIALIWLAPPNLPAFIAFFTMFPILYQHILSGLEHTDPKLVEMAKVFRKNAIERLFHIFWPSARKHIYAGASTALGFGWRAVIIGEVLASPVFGIGTSMKKAQAYINMPELLAWTLIAVIISFGFEHLIQGMAGKNIKSKVRVTEKRTEKFSHLRETEIISIENLKLKFNDKTIFNNFSFTFAKNRLYLLKSASGKGKTTLLKLLAGIQKPDSGTINRDNKAIVSFAFQDYRLLPWLNLYENIAFVQPHYPEINKQEHEKIMQIISMMELSDNLNQLPAELSGGQQQRAVLARALSVNCHLLLLDEPLNGLEKELKQKVVKTTEILTEENQPIIVWATHDDPEQWFQGKNHEILNLTSAQI